MELAGGVGRIPGFVRRDPGHDGGEVGLKAIAMPRPLAAIFVWIQLFFVLV